VATTSLETKLVPQRPINRFSVLDNDPVQILLLGSATATEIAKVAGISPASAKSLVEFRKKHPIRSLTDLYVLEGMNKAAVERLRRKGLLDTDDHCIITDVAPVEGKVMSDKPFALRISFTASERAVPVLASVNVEWAGETFIMEQRVTPANHRAGYVDVLFDRKHTLPTGLAVFRATLSTRRGAQGTFRITCVVLPSNPFSLSLSPDVNFVTGTYSARAVRSGSAYDTSIGVMLSNGDGTPVPVLSQFTWKFWDGGVGGSLVEQGVGDFGGAISVPAFGTWGGWIAFNSPHGSGVFNKYDGKEDMTIEIIMNRTDNNTAVSGTITVRTMFQFGVNVTQVAFEDFIGQEGADLDAAAAVTRTIYERRDMTFATDDRGIEQARAGPFESITSESEARDLWEQWSGPNTNNNIDAFVVNQLLIDGKYDGLDGDIPGPTSHDGRSSGTVQNKSGFVDANGVRRLHVEYLGMLMGHELGHYLGLSHTNDAGNLMLPSSGQTDTNLTYDQYRTMIRHGWVFIG
jgi:Helix-hairpin-helix motif/Matrixin